MSSTHLCILLFTFAQVLIKLSWGLLSVLSQLSVLLKACLRSKAETSYYLTPAEEWLKTEKEKYMMNEENRSEQNRHFFHMKFLKQNHLAWVRRVNLQDDIYFMRASLVTHLIKISASVFNHLWAQNVDSICFQPFMSTGCWYNKTEASIKMKKTYSINVSLPYELLLCKHIVEMSPEKTCACAFKSILGSSFLKLISVKCHVRLIF